MVQNNFLISEEKIIKSRAICLLPTGQLHQIKFIDEFDYQKQVFCIFGKDLFRANRKAINYPESVSDKFFVRKYFTVL